MPVKPRSVGSLSRASVCKPACVYLELPERKYFKGECRPVSTLAQALQVCVVSYTAHIRQAIITEREAVECCGKDSRNTWARF